MADTGTEMAEVTLSKATNVGERIVERALETRRRERTIETKIQQMSQELEGQAQPDGPHDASSEHELAEEEPVLEKTPSEVGKRQSLLIQQYAEGKISVDTIAHQLIEERDRELAAEAHVGGSLTDEEREVGLERNEVTRYRELSNEQKAELGLGGVPETAYGSETIHQVMAEAQAAARTMRGPSRTPERDHTLETTDIELERQR